MEAEQVGSDALRMRGGGRARRNPGLVQAARAAKQEQINSAKTQTNITARLRVPPRPVEGDSAKGTSPRHRFAEVASRAAKAAKTSSEDGSKHGGSKHGANAYASAADEKDDEGSAEATAATDLRSKERKHPSGAKFAFSPLSVFGGVSATEARRLRIAPDRVGLVHARLCRMLTERRFNGGLAVDPPVFSRVYQALSEGMVAFAQARKVEDTPFPFPYAQMVATMLLLLIPIVPLVTVAKVGHFEDEWGTSEIDQLAKIEGAFPYSMWVCSMILGPALSFVTILSYFGLNEVARDMEEPFLYPPNDLPCATFQDDFNMRLMSILQAVCTGEGPAGEQLSMDEDDADTVATASAVVDFARAAAQPLAWGDFAGSASGRKSSKTEVKLPRTTSVGAIPSTASAIWSSITPRSGESRLTTEESLARVQRAFRRRNKAKKARHSNRDLILH